MDHSSAVSGDGACNAGANATEARAFRPGTSIAGTGRRNLGARCFLTLELASTLPTPSYLRQRAEIPRIPGLSSNPTLTDH